MRRHYRPMSPAARDALAERKRSEAESAGIPMRDDADCRRPCVIDLRGAGGPLLTLEPVPRKVAWRARDDSGAVVKRAAIKSLLHSVADDMARMLSFRSSDPG